MNDFLSHCDAPCPADESFPRIVVERLILERDEARADAERARGQIRCHLAVKEQADFIAEMLRRRVDELLLERDRAAAEAEELRKDRDGLAVVCEAWRRDFRAIRLRLSAGRPAD